MNENPFYTNSMLNYGIIFYGKDLKNDFTMEIPPTLNPKP